jgi:hypothetical protein
MINSNSYIGRQIQTNPPKVATNEPPKEEPKREVTAGNVAKYVAAETSVIVEGEVEDAVYEERKAHCVGCPSRVLSDKLPDELGYCRSCGCGVSERAKLTVKLRMPAATCPQQKWGKAPGKRRNVVRRAANWIGRIMSR